jgi:hypothetical protein
MTSNFYVFVSNTPFTSYNLNATINQAGVSNYYVPGYSGTPGAINVNRTGRYVRVQLVGTDFLGAGGSARMEHGGKDRMDGYGSSRHATDDRGQERRRVIYPALLAAAAAASASRLTITSVMSSAAGVP